MVRHSSKLQPEIVLLGSKAISREEQEDSSSSSLPHSAVGDPLCVALFRGLLALSVPGSQMFPADRSAIARISISSARLSTLHYEHGHSRSLNVIKIH
ncbi:unnamed protein product [Protopolystoma xenopodis]|uniref:Uncharacterized protein n=1 Tax=Protopolystoma xenopodis TaxID=117903 RepID=A0A3S5CMQ9_9PLAT|nr:unnamed protein product [Protopolystoma xenopodis]